MCVCVCAFVVVVVVAYHVPQWNFRARLCRTNMAANTYCRSPGMFLFLETLMAIHVHVALK